MTEEQQQEAMFAGFLHDIGAFTEEEKLKLLKEEDESVHDHADTGARIIESFHLFKNIAKIVRYHHVLWDHGKGCKYKDVDVPISSHIVHLADRIVVLMDPNHEIIGQIGGIFNEIKRFSGSVFMPELVDTLLKMENRESIWLDVLHPRTTDYLATELKVNRTKIGLDDGIQLSMMLANIIDFKSPFTAYHSFGVAAMAEKLASLVGFSENECKMMLIAGYLHDIGKLAVDDSILLKLAKLTPEEFNDIRSHTYHTYRTLQSISDFDTINIWASYHHEKLNGKGYPFHIKGDEIPLGSRIMAAADIYTAVTEDRPYRKGMDKDKVIRVLKGFVKDQSICPFVYSALEANYDLLESVREEAQELVGERYKHVRREA